MSRNRGWSADFMYWKSTDSDVVIDAPAAPILCPTQTDDVMRPGCREWRREAHLQSNANLGCIGRRDSIHDYVDVHVASQEVQRRLQHTDVALTSGRMTTPA